MPRLHPARASALLGLAMLVGLILSGPARAQQPASGPADPLQPAASQQATSQAAALYAEGAALFKQWHFDKAEQKFREALAHGEHPLIHLYLARALEKQGRLVEAHEALQQALRPGAEALPPEDVEVAGELQRSLELRLAQLEVSCYVQGAEVYLDGEPWFTASGRRRRMLVPGQHVLIARKPGYFPLAEPVSLIPGKRARVVLRMTADVVHVERRWESWQPWALSGAGAAMSLAGGLLLWDAKNDYAAIQTTLDACEPGNCKQIPQHRLDGATWSERIGTGALITGGAILITGLAGVLLNLPRPRRSEPAGGVERFEIAPILSGDTAGISAVHRF